MPRGGCCALFSSEKGGRDKNYEGGSGGAFMADGEHMAVGGGADSHLSKVGGAGPAGYCGQRTWLG
jgi:hypothetical protein